MTILEQLRERKEKIIEEIGTMEMFKGSVLAIEIKNYLTDSDLALENALLKLKNRGVEIADLKDRIKKLVEFKANVRSKFLNTTLSPQEFAGEIEILLNT